MPSRELDGYIEAANKMNKQSEPKEQGLSGQDAINAMQFDPAITVK